jgi:hypothetical protein
MRVKKLLCTLSGDDYTIISRCGSRLQNRFAMIGTFVFVVFGLCFVSSYFTFTQLFQGFLLGIPAALFFAFTITNLYLLLLYTLSKNVLPHRSRIDGKIISIVLRVGFLCFIAIVVSKPLEVLMFSGVLNSEISAYKEKKLEEYTAITSRHFDGEINSLEEMIQKIKDVPTEVGAAEIEKYRLIIEKRERQKRDLILKMKALVNGSNYYVQSIVILNRNYPICWVFTFLIVIVFLIPAYLKNFISATDNYYAFKKEIETRLVQEEYDGFKNIYSELFKARFKKKKTLTEHFSDAPFNTVPKTDPRNFLKEEDLIAELYDA